MTRALREGLTEKVTFEWSSDSVRNNHVDIWESLPGGGNSQGSLWSVDICLVCSENGQGTRAEGVKWGGEQ